MHWFLIAIIGPFLYAITNHIDKVLLEKYFKSSGVGTLLLFSSILSILALPFIFIFEPNSLNIAPLNALILGFVGLLNVLVLWCYLMALKNEEASVAVVFYQLVPVFGYILGLIILDETLSFYQIIAMAIIILGTAIVSFEVDADNKFKLRTNTIFFMTSAAFFWGLESVIFKAVAIEENVLRSLFWEHLSLAFVGILIFIFIKRYRHHFISAIKNNSLPILGLNVANEGIYMLGNVAFAFAYLLAPVALVLLTQSYQPLFVFAIGIFLTIFFPKVVVEKIEIKHLWQKIIAIAITGIGTYMLLAV